MDSQYGKCKHKEPLSELLDLPERQAGLGRHRCAACAYEAGLKSQESTMPVEPSDVVWCDDTWAPKVVIASLPKSQAGPGRHRCVICAYQKGRMASSAASTSQLNHEVPDFYKIRLEITPPPPRSNVSGLRARKSSSSGGLDYLDAENKHRRLGLEGERLVIKYERQALIKAGRQDLADKVRHIALEGDGAGYDIQSYTESGNIKHIEVKTTRGSAETYFYITSNEVTFSREHPDTYYLYRVYSYGDGDIAKMYIWQGIIEDGFRLEPTQYRATL